MAAFAQHARFKGANQAELAQARSMVEQSWPGLAWPGFAIAEISQPLVEKAGVYAEAFALRGYDGVQLAATQLRHEQFAPPLTFACFDRRLNQAALRKVLGAVPWLPAIEKAEQASFPDQEQSGDEQLSAIEREE